MKRFYIPAPFLLLLLTGSSWSAKADPLNFFLDNPAQIANPGDTINFYADVFASDFVFLNGDNFSFTAPGTIDDSGVFLNFTQLFSPDDEFNDILFTYTLPIDIPTGTYLGTFELYGGPTNASNLLQDSQNFSITTVNGPEPASLALMAAGCLGLFGFSRKRK